MVSEGKLPNKQTINILMELLDEAGQHSKVSVNVDVHFRVMTCSGRKRPRTECRKHSRDGRTA